MQCRDGPTIYLIDTPGFDDTRRTDAQVLSEVSYFLGATYSKDVKLAGNHLSTTHQGEPDEELCHEEVGHVASHLRNHKPANVFLATTVWDELRDSYSRQVGINRENELRTQPNYWANMVAGGGTISGTRGPTSRP